MMIFAPARSKQKVWRQLQATFKGSGAMSTIILDASGRLLERAAERSATRPARLSRTAEHGQPPISRPRRMLNLAIQRNRREPLANLSHPAEDLAHSNWFGASLNQSFENLLAPVLS
jgi:hypothetical protein